MPDITIISPFDWISILAALVCGAIVGIERQLRGKPVGIRTSSLIILGTYIFVVSAASVSTESSDPSRVIGQVVTGIGFLGAGVMISSGGSVFGVTSAATIWALSAVGVVLATAGALVAIKLAIVIVLILWGVDLLEDSFASLTRGVHRKYQSYRHGQIPADPEDPDA